MTLFFSTLFLSVLSSLSHLTSLSIECTGKFLSEWNGKSIRVQVKNIFTPDEAEDVGKNQETEETGQKKKNNNTKNDIIYGWCYFFSLFLVSFFSYQRACRNRCDDDLTQTEKRKTQEKEKQNWNDPIISTFQFVVLFPLMQLCTFSLRATCHMNEHAKSLEKNSDFPFHSRSLGDAQSEKSST